MKRQTSTSTTTLLLSIYSALNLALILVSPSAPRFAKRWPPPAPSRRMDVKQQRCAQPAAPEPAALPSRSGPEVQLRLVDLKERGWGRVGETHPQQ